MDWTPSTVLGALGVAGGIAVGFFKVAKALGGVLSDMAQMRRELDGKASGSDTALRLAALDEKVQQRATLDRLAAVDQRVSRLETAADRDHGAH